MLVSCLAYSSTLKVEVIRSSETSVDFQRITRRYIPEDKRTLHNYRCDNLKYYTLMVLLTALILYSSVASLTSSSSVQRKVPVYTAHIGDSQTVLHANRGLGNSPAVPYG
jgi:hypothetical protein